jgi:hypothetical protein
VSCVPCRTADAAATFDALMRWFAVFGVVLLLISDREKPLQERGCMTSTEGAGIQASFHYGDFPWMNRTIESAFKQVILAFRAVLSEFNMYADEWPLVVNMVQSVLKNSLSTSPNK